MLKMKYKLISATMVIAPLLNTGVVTTVYADSIHKSESASKLKVVSKHYHKTFAERLNDLVTSGVINSYQESKVLDIANSKENFKAGLDNLAASGIINPYQEVKILSIYTYIR
jgi:hypothetical protein